MRLDVGAILDLAAHVLYSELIDRLWNLLGKPNHLGKQPMSHFIRVLYDECRLWKGLLGPEGTSKISVTWMPWLARLNPFQLPVNDGVLNNSRVPVPMRSENLPVPYNLRSRLSWYRRLSSPSYF